ncbi:cytochrome P450 [Candidatus Poriferisocius sp.]|uniref:cytochrome P450 n=1 Tax=Candidatus Poriferisocius sp. TaxID=3101276 RepID=UPI003B017640
MDAAATSAIALEASTVIDPDVWADPYPFYQRLRQEHPVWLVPGLDLAFVATHDLIVDALRRIDDFSNHLDVLVITGDDGNPALFRTDEFGEGTTTLATADPPEHTVHRSVVFPELVAKRMEAMRPEIEAFIDEQFTVARAQGAKLGATSAPGAKTIQSASHTSRVEWASTVAHPVPARVIGRLIGLPDEDWPNVMKWALHGGLLLAGFPTRANLAAITEESIEAGGYLFTKLMESGREPGDDLVGVCAKAVANGDLDVGDAIGTLTVLLGAGGESTASLIGNAVRMLADDPALQAQIRADHSLLGNFIEEAVRLESPFRGHYRQVKRDCELGGVALKAGTTAFLLWSSANRDPAEHDRPDEVVLNRRIPRSHLAFGRGIHHCVGAPLARLETLCSLERLLQESSWFTLADDDPPRWENSIFVRRHEHLPLDVTWN